MTKPDTAAMKAMADFQDAGRLVAEAMNKQIVANAGLQRWQQLLAKSVMKTFGVTAAELGLSWTFGTILHERHHGAGATRVMFLRYMRYGERPQMGEPWFIGRTMHGDRYAEQRGAVGRIDQFPASRWEPDE